LLVELGRAGLEVVRLKGGDPFVYGRGGEEALALAGAGVPFEVVPGVSSASAVPAAAGIPVTHRGLSTSFTVVTGHSRHAPDIEIDWEALALKHDGWNANPWMWIVNVEPLVVRSVQSFVSPPPLPLHAVADSARSDATSTSERRRTGGLLDRGSAG
jgi:hypothetical protein